MSADEKFLLRLLAAIKDRNQQAVLLQSFIAENGPLSEQAAALVREQLNK